MSKKKRKKDIPQEDIEVFDKIKTIKTNITNILKDKIILPIISDIVVRTNKIVIHACQFIKFYCIHLYDNNLELPLIDKKFVANVFIS